jgi:hypothetical protein
LEIFIFFFLLTIAHQREIQNVNYLTKIVERKTKIKNYIFFHVIFFFIFYLYKKNNPAQ